MEMARDLAAEMADRGEGVVLDQFGNADNPLAHFRGTGARSKASSSGDLAACVHAYIYVLHAELIPQMAI